jgi:hypothetical protein
LSGWIRASRPLVAAGGAGQGPGLRDSDRAVGAVSLRCCRAAATTQTRRRLWLSDGARRGRMQRRRRIRRRSVDPRQVGGICATAVVSR